MLLESCCVYWGLFVSLLHSEEPKSVAVGNSRYRRMPHHDRKIVGKRQERVMWL
jgi:hypothetical protein